MFQIKIINLLWTDKNRIRFCINIFIDFIDYLDILQLLLQVEIYFNSEIIDFFLILDVL